MRNLILSLIVFTVAGCNSTSNVSKVQVQPKDSKCDLIAEAVGPMVATKWALKETNKTQKDKELGDWRMLGLVHHDAFEKAGYSLDETKAIAKEVYEIDISDQMEYDILSYRYFYKAQCQLQAKNIKPLPLADTYKTLDQCWYPDKNKGLNEEICFKQVLSGEIVL